MLSTIVILVALNALGCLVVYLLLSGRIRRNASPAAQLQGLREEVDRLVIELNQTTDRNIALIEDKIAEISDALSKADRKMSIFKRENEKHDVGAKVYSRILESKATGEDEERDTPPAPEPKAERGPATRPGEALKDLRAEVLALHRAGFSAQLISSRVGAPLGEVELVISLEKRKASG